MRVGVMEMKKWDMGNGYEKMGWSGWVGWVVNFA